MKKFALIALALSFTLAATAQNASANWLGLARAKTVQTQTVQADTVIPVKAVSHVKKSVIVHTDACACGGCCQSHIKTNYPAPGYENVFNRGYSRTTMGYKVLFDF